MLTDQESINPEEKKRKKKMKNLIRYD